MIAKVTGQAILVSNSFVIIEANKIGYKVFLPAHIIKTVSVFEKEYSFFTYLAVRETSLDLYGFDNLEELDLFEMLIGVSGIGPKSALAILGITSIETLKQAIASGETSYLTKVSGIGRKSAEKIVVELRDKLSSDLNSTEGGFRQSEEALDVLQALGYSMREAREAMQKVGGGFESLNEKVKEALKILSSKKK